MEELIREGNKAAERFLERRGYKILEKDCDGVDIVAENEDAYVFVNVKVRKHGFASDTINLERYEKAAQKYLSENKLDEKAIRFDVLCIVPTGEDRALIRHHINAHNSSYNSLLLELLEAGEITQIAYDKLKG